MKYLSILIPTLALAACGGGGSSEDESPQGNSFVPATYVIQVGREQCAEYFVRTENEQNTLISAGAYPGTCSDDNSLGSCSYTSPDYGSQLRMVYYPNDLDLLTPAMVQESCLHLGGSFQEGSVVAEEPAVVEKTFITQNNSIACTEQTTSFPTRQSLIESSGGVEGSCDRTNALGVCVTGLAEENLVIKTIYYPDDAGLRAAEDLVDGCEHIGGSFIYGSDIAEPNPDPNPNPNPNPNPDPNPNPNPDDVVDMDADNDGFADFIEVEYGTNPDDAESTPLSLLSNSKNFSDDNDVDGFVDSLEAWFLTDPNDSSSTPLDENGDFIPDGFDSVTDTGAPKLLGFHISQSEVHVVTGEEKVRFNLTVSDDISGIDSLAIYLRSPSGQSVNASLYSQDLGEVVHALSVESTDLGEFAEAGIWSIDYIVVYDTLGNSSTYRSMDLSELGITPSLQVHNQNSDTQPPSLSLFGFSQSSIAIETGAEFVTFELDVSDDKSGLDSVGIYLVSPNGQTVSSSLYSQDFGGLSHSLNIQSTAFGLYAESGIWTISYIVLEDSSGNSISYTSTDLDALGFDSSIQIENDSSDIQAPTLDAFSFAEGEILIQTGLESVIFNLEVSDNLSGLESVAVYLSSPSGQSVSASLYSADLGGTSHTLTMQSTQFGEFAELGSWTINYIVLEDLVGNRATYYSSELISNGFEASIQVVNQ